MRALLQRVRRAQVDIDGVCVGKIDQGLLIFLGVTLTDTPEDAVKLAKKCADLRIFEDENQKLNLSLLDIGGSALVVSQFTLYGDTAGSGRRPSFSAAARPDVAVPCYEKFISALKEPGICVETGRFGADMQVELVNDGPVTLMLELPQKTGKDKK